MLTPIKFCSQNLFIWASKTLHDVSRSGVCWILNQTSSIFNDVLTLADLDHVSWARVKIRKKVLFKSHSNSFDILILFFTMLFGFAGGAVISIKFRLTLLWIWFYRDALKPETWIYCSKAFSLILCLVKILKLNSFFQRIKILSKNLSLRSESSFLPKITQNLMWMKFQSRYGWVQLQ